jgi:hypothetical protein
MKPPILDDPLLTEREAADYLRWQEQTLRKRRWQGLPPKFVKLGGQRVRYRMSDLQQFVYGNDAA